MRPEVDDMMAEICFKQKVDQGLKDIEEGRIISHEEAKRKIEKIIHCFLKEKK